MNKVEHVCASVSFSAKRAHTRLKSPRSQRWRSRLLLRELLGNFPLDSQVLCVMTLSLLVPLCTGTRGLCVAVRVWHALTQTTRSIETHYSTLATMTSDIFAVCFRALTVIWFIYSSYTSIKRYKIKKWVKSYRNCVVEISCLGLDC